MEYLISVMTSTFVDEIVTFLLVSFLTRWKVVYKRNKIKNNEPYHETDMKPFLIGLVLLLLFLVSSAVTASVLKNGLENIHKGSNLAIWLTCYIYATSGLDGVFRTIKLLSLKLMRINDTTITEVEKEKNPDDNNQG